MKYAVAVLIGAIKAIKLNDAPGYFNEPVWRETFPSAAGLSQVQDAPAAFNEPVWRETFPSAAGLSQVQDAPPHFSEPTWRETFPSAAGLTQISACEGSYQMGVECLPNDMLFADGVEQSDDMFVSAEENKEEPAKAEEKKGGPAKGEEALGVNQQMTKDIVYDTKGYGAPEKDLVLDPKIGRNHSTFYVQEDENLHYLQLDDGRTHTSFYAQTEAAPGYPSQYLMTGEAPAAAAPAAAGAAGEAPPAEKPEKKGANQAASAIVKEKYNKEGYPEPEKVVVLDPKIARTHTTFYVQHPQLVQLEDGPEPASGANVEKTKAIKFDNKGYQAPEKVLVLDPKVGRTHTTFY